LGERDQVGVAGLRVGADHCGSAIDSSVTTAADTCPILTNSVKGAIVGTDSLGGTCRAVPILSTLALGRGARCAAHTVVRAVIIACSLDSRGHNRSGAVIAFKARSAEAFSMQTQSVGRAAAGTMDINSTHLACVASHTLALATLACSTTRAFVQVGTLSGGRGNFFRASTATKSNSTNACTIAAVASASTGHASVLGALLSKRTVGTSKVFHTVAGGGGVTLADLGKVLGLG